MKTHTIAVQESEDEGHELVVFYEEGGMFRSGTLEQPPEYSDPHIDRIEKDGDELSIQEMEVYGCSELEWLDLNYIDLRG